MRDNILIIINNINQVCYSTNNNTTTISKGLGLTNAPEECVHSDTQKICQITLNHLSSNFN